jgi:spermidine synthase
MSGEPFQCGYGAIVNEDVSVLEKCLSECCATAERESRHVRVLEIGMHDGGTAKGIELFCARNPWGLTYVGIDPDEGKTRPRYVPGIGNTSGTVVIGDSAEVFGQVGTDFDLIWVDGCHCMNHVILDTVQYGERVRRGGFMLFHDVNPAGQGKEHQYHGPETPEFGLAIDMAHEAIGFPWSDRWRPWALFAEAWPIDRENCGTRAFRKGSP